MELMNPTLTVQNAKGEHWLVTLQHVWSNAEQINVTVQIPKSHGSLKDVQEQTVQRAVALLQLLQRE